MPYSIGANTKSTFEVGPEAHKLNLEFEVDGTIHVGQPVVLHSDGDKVSPATAASLETDIIGVSIHEGKSAYGDYVVVAMKGYAVIWAKAMEVIVPGPIVYNGFDTSDAYAGSQETFGGYNEVGNILGAVAQVETVTLTGASGTCNVTMGGMTRLATFDTSLNTTHANFVSAWKSDYAAIGIILSGTTTLVFTGAYTGKPFVAGTVSAAVSGDLTGTVAHTTALNVKQVDTVTLTGTTGTATITGAGSLSKLATYDTNLGTTGDNFVTAHAAAYLVEGIVITSPGDNVVFTANVAGTPFTNPIITNTTLTLDGTVANTTLNSVAGWAGRIFGWALDAAAAVGTLIRVLIKD